MSGVKKCGPNLRGAPHTHDRQTRGAADARPPHAARFKPPAQPAPPARPAAAVQPKRTPPAPPVYRPQPTPQVLQKKSPPGRTTGNTPAPRPAQTPARTAAPPVYRPGPNKVMQPKAATPLHTPPKSPPPGAASKPPRVAPPNARATPQARPQAAPQAARAQNSVQRKTAPAAPQPPARPAPPAAPLSLRRPAVLQMMWEDPADHYKGSWPPPDDPVYPPPTPSHNYYKEASEYFTSKREFETADEYMDFWEDKTGKSVGMSSGTGEEDDYDESYVDIPLGIRPSAPAALWNTVYAGLTDSGKYPGFQWIDCQEYCSDRIYIDKKTKKEDKVGKRPPMCHIVAFNHTKWAVSWLYANRLKYNYSGPDVTGMDNDTWRKLVWHKSNLRPGHSKCNSKTASQAKGNPATTKDEQAAKNYVLVRLKKINPHWF